MIQYGVDICKCLFDLYSPSSHLRRARFAVQLPIVLLLYIILSMSSFIANFMFQRLGGVEPLHQAWEARILPLYYSRVGKAIIAEKRRECKHALPLAVPAVRKLVRKLGLSFAALLSYTRVFCYTVFYESNTALYGALCGRRYRRAE